MMWIQSFKHSGNAIYATLPSCACLIDQSPIEGAGHLSQASNEYLNLGHAVVDKLYGGVLSCSCCGNADPKVYSTAAPPPLPASALHTSAMKWGFKGILKSCVLKKGPGEEPLTATYATQVVTACADVISSPASKHAALA